MVANEGVPEIFPNTTKLGVPEKIVDIDSLIVAGEDIVDLTPLNFCSFPKAT